MEERLPRKLAAILYADVAGYSRLTGDDEDATHLRLRDYLDLFAKTIENHHGQVMHYAGTRYLPSLMPLLMHCHLRLQYRTRSKIETKICPMSARFNFESV